MGQWGNTDNAANSVKWAAQSIQAGSGHAAKASNNTALYNNVTSSAFISELAVGQFGVSKTEMGITSDEGPYVHAPGWALRRVGEGPLTGVTVSAGSKFVNGETLIVSGGSVNAEFVLTTNSNSNLVSATPRNGGVFPNTSVLTYTFTHEKHIDPTNPVTITDGGLGYDNADYIVVSNSISDARATVGTDADGNITGFTVVSLGLFANDAANTDVIVTIYAANGGSSNGSDAVLVANLVASTGGTNTAPVLGGRAGRVTYETLAVVKEITSGTGDDTYLPNA